MQPVIDAGRIMKSLSYAVGAGEGLIAQVSVAKTVLSHAEREMARRIELAVERLRNYGSIHYLLLEGMTAKGASRLDEAKKIIGDFDVSYILDACGREIRDITREVSRNAREALNMPEILFSQSEENPVIKMSNLGYKINAMNREVSTGLEFIKARTAYNIRTMQELQTSLDNRVASVVSLRSGW